MSGYPHKNRLDDRFEEGWLRLRMTVCGWISAAQSTQRKWLAILPRRTSAKHPKVRFEGSQVPLALVPTDGGRSPSQSSTMQRPSHSELSSQLFPPSLVGTTQAGEPINPTGCIEPPEASHCSAGGTCKVEGDESRVWQLAKSKKRAAAQRVVKVRIGSVIPLSQSGSKGLAGGKSAFCLEA